LRLERASQRLARPLEVQAGAFDIANADR